MLTKYPVFLFSSVLVWSAPVHEEDESSKAMGGTFDASLFLEPLGSVDALGDSIQSSEPKPPCPRSLDLLDSDDSSLSTRSCKRKRGMKLKAHEGRRKRHLSVVTTSSVAWNFPSQTILKLTTGSSMGNPEPSHEALLLYPTISYSNLLVSATGDQFDLTNHPSPKIKLVQLNTLRTACSDSLFDVPLDRWQSGAQNFVYSSMSINKGPLTLVRLGGAQDSYLSAEDIDLRFMHGGSYKLCYAPDGTFSDSDLMFFNNILPMTLNIIGVSSGCTSDGCLRLERWDCYFGFLGELPGNLESCKLSVVRMNWGLNSGVDSKATWSAKFDPDSLSEGVWQRTNERSCADPATTPEMSNFEILDYVDETSLFSIFDSEHDIILPPVKASVSVPFTMAACYCPDIDSRTSSFEPNLSCNKFNEYIQQFGLIYFWTMQICNVDDVDCNPQFARVVPQQAFLLKIRCPPGGGCSHELGLTLENRLKILSYDENGDLPNWHEGHSCKSSLSGDAEKAIWTNEKFRFGGSEPLNGGGRADFKYWSPASDSIDNDKYLPYAPVLRIKPEEKVDICYCNSDCNILANWIKVGQIKGQTTFGIASVTMGCVGCSAKPKLRTIKYLNKPGSVTLFSGQSSSASRNPWDGPLFSQTNTLVNIISLDNELLYSGQTLETFYNLESSRPFLAFQSTVDGVCRARQYSNNLIIGPASKEQAKQFIATRHCANADTGTDTTPCYTDRYLPFSGPGNDRFLTVKLAGTLAICYCGEVSDILECASEDAWFVAGLHVIRGPKGGQTWDIPVGLVFGLDIEGWGLGLKLENDTAPGGQDYVRIISSTSRCTDRTFNPSGNTEFKIGCPTATGEGCTNAFPDSDIYAENTRSGLSLDNTTVPWVVGFELMLDRTILHFSGNVSGFLETGDLIILDKRNMTIDGKLSNQWTKMDLWHAYRLSGRGKYADLLDSSCEDGRDCEENVFGNKVTVVSEGSVSIPVGFDPSIAPVPVVGSLWGVDFIRHSKLSTRRNLRSVIQKPDLVVCWGTRDQDENAGGILYYGTVGRLTFSVPPEMKASRVALAGRESGKTIPIIISFVPSFAYNTLEEYDIVLKISFLDLTKLSPRLSGDTLPGGGDSPEIAPEEELSEESSRQHDCGRLFLEMWSDDQQQGMPNPISCWYSKLYFDRAPFQELETPYRDFFIKFRKRNGIRNLCFADLRYPERVTDCLYQLVLLANPQGLGTGAEIVHISTSCSNCPSNFQYTIFEMGRAQVERGTDSGPDQSATGNFWEPGYSPELMSLTGFGVLDQETRLLELKGQNVQLGKPSGDKVYVGAFRINLRGRNIEPGCYLRLFLWPLTLWRLHETACTAVCENNPNTYRSCGVDGGQTICTPEAVDTQSLLFNAIRLRLPLFMDTLTWNLTLNFTISDIYLPELGFFPQRFGLLLTTPQDFRPSYTTSSNFVLKEPDLGQHIAKILVTGRTGSGDRPFINQQENMVILQLRFGVSIWSSNKGGASLTVWLPPKYKCQVPADPSVSSADHSLFSSSSNTGGFLDFRIGELSVDPSDGIWRSNTSNLCCSNDCKYSFMTNQVIFATSVVYLKLKVQNPPHPLRKSDPSNSWKIELSSRGLAPKINIHSMSLFGFISLEEEDASFQGNLAVLQPLSYSLLQPSVGGMIASASQATTHFLYIFFRGSTDVGTGGFLMVDAPDGFDFGDPCNIRSLENRQFAFKGARHETLFPLSSPGVCRGYKYPVHKEDFSNNRALFSVEGLLQGDINYAFMIEVSNPSFYSKEQQFSWFLWILDKNSYCIEGTDHSMPSNPELVGSREAFYDSSWGLYSNRAEEVQIILETQVSGNLRPFAMSELPVELSVYPITVQEDMTTSLRITLPANFIFEFTEERFNASANGSTASFPGVPSLQFGNELIFEEITLRREYVYGFRHKIRIPTLNPITSSNNIIYELGYKGQSLSERKQAKLIDAGQVMAFKNCFVTPFSSLVGFKQNLVEFRFELATGLSEGDGIMLTGDGNTDGIHFKEDCEPLPVPTASKNDANFLPDKIVCSFIPDLRLVSDREPRIQLEVGPEDFLPGLYAFELLAENPDYLIPYPGMWKFSSMRRIAVYPSLSEEVDFPMVVEGFTVDQEIYSAGLVDLSEEQRHLSMRDDRPLRSNNVIFQFVLAVQPSRTEALTIIAPADFVFHEDCTNDFFVERNQILGGSDPNELGSLFAEWPPEAFPSICRGGANVARIEIPAGLSLNNRYIFRISIAANPPVQPERNYWSLSLGRQTSAPIPGFLLYTFTHTALESISTARNREGQINGRDQFPVIMRFRPVNSIPVGGHLRITAPAGFEWFVLFLNCDASLSKLSDSNSTIGSFSRGSDYSCSVEDLSILKITLIGTTEMETGKDFELVATVMNPMQPQAAELWKFESFTSFQAIQENSLDEASIMGYPINEAFLLFQVLNTYNERNGRANVRDVAFTVRLPFPLIDHDVFVLDGPSGYIFMSDLNPILRDRESMFPFLTADLDRFTGGSHLFGDCLDFGWPNAQNPLPGSAAPECRCSGSLLNTHSKCQMVYSILEFKIPAFPQEEDLTFQMTVVNPQKIPATVDSYWRMRMFRTDYLYLSRASLTWSISPQLENVDIFIVGQLLAAGSTSSIAIELTPVSEANILEVLASLPTGFDFGAVRPSSGEIFAVDTLLSEGARLVLKEISFVPDIPRRLQVSDVILGQKGGATKFSLFTYQGDVVPENMRDEKRSFRQGFRLPGRFFVSSYELQSAYSVAGAALYPLKSQLRPKIGEPARASFDFTVSQKAHAHDWIKVYSIGEGRYYLEGSGLELFDITVDRVLETTAFVNRTHEPPYLSIMLLPSQPESAVALDVSRSYRLSVSVLPRVGDSTWKFDVEDNLELPLNTDDGLTPMFRGSQAPVPGIMVQVDVQYTPPFAWLWISISLENLQPLTSFVSVIAPPGFVFHPGNCGENCRPLPGYYPGTDRPVARVGSVSIDLSETPEISVRLRTPKHSGSAPEDASWYIIAESVLGEVLGWGEGEGFVVENLRNAVIEYPPVLEAAQQQCVVSFRLIREGVSRIEIRPPNEYVMLCKDDGFFIKMDLPDSAMCSLNSNQRGLLAIDIPEPLPPGSYTFVIGIDVPQRFPSNHTFDIVLKDGLSDALIEGVFDMPPQPDPDGLRVVDGFLSWTSSTLSAQSTLTVSFLLLADTQQIEAIIIEFPDKFIHDVQNVDQVRSLNRKFPKMPQDWVDVSNADSIRIYVDDTINSRAPFPLDLIRANDYSFSFPILIPGSIPPHNVWYVVFCRDRQCSGREDAVRTIVRMFRMIEASSTHQMSLPIAGFTAGQTCNTCGNQVTNQGCRSSYVNALILLFVVCFSPFGYKT